MIIEQLRECGDYAFQIMSEMNPVIKKQISNKFLTDILPKTLEGYEKILSQNSGKYIVGDSLTLADLALVNGWEWLDYASRKVLNNYSLVKNHEIFVRSIPEVSSWLKMQRPLTVLKNA
jgi:glutathione S-transferase